MFFRRFLILILLFVGGTDLIVDGTGGVEAAELEVFPTDLKLRYRTDLQRIVVVLHEQDHSREVTNDVTSRLWSCSCKTTTMRCRSVR